MSRIQCYMSFRASSPKRGQTHYHTTNWTMVLFIYGELEETIWMGAFQVERRGPGKEGSKWLLARCLDLFSKHLLSPSWVLRRRMLVSGIEEEDPIQEVLPPLVTLTGLKTWGEEPLLWRNSASWQAEFQEVVNRGTGVPGPRQRPETHLRK